MQILWQYIRCELNPKEIDDLWALLLQYPELYDDLCTLVELQNYYMNIKS